MSDRESARPPSIATRRGDGGETDLLFGSRVPKCHPQIECCGAIDELNAALGVARAASLASEAAEDLIAIQKTLITIMGEIACAEDQLERYYESDFPRLGSADVEFLDQRLAGLEEALPPFRDWALPGAQPEAAALEMARSIARRAERGLIALREEKGFPLRPVISEYFNRLSDYLWLRARESERNNQNGGEGG